MVSRKGLRFIAILTMAGIVASCSSGSGSNEVALDGSDFLVTIKTDMGEMKAILYDRTPKHKENFLKLVNEGFYDSLLFHRVMQNFMIQGGDPDSKHAGQGMPLGSGGPGYTIPAEFVPELFHEKGALSAARQPDQVNPQKASSGSQFYIVQGTVGTVENLELDLNLLHQKCNEFIAANPGNPMSTEIRDAFNQGQEAYIAKLKEVRTKIEEEMDFKAGMAPDRLEKYTTVGGTPFLDENYTVFGKVIHGIEVIDAIAAIQVDQRNRPILDSRMYITVEEMSRKEIADKYGNPYIQ